MSILFRKISVLLLLSFVSFCLYSYLSRTSPSLPVIAIANYGPHASLQMSIRGIKEGLAAKGYKEHDNVAFEVLDVNFDLTLIHQMLTKLRASRPKAIILISTPIAQSAKEAIKDIPLFFTDITEPVTSGLLDDYHQTSGNLTGASDKQDLSTLLSFAQKVLPHAKRVGLLYATSEANDVALVEMMKSAAAALDMEVISIPIDHVRDIPFRMQTLKGKVDFMYVGVSGMIQPSLPAIVLEADRLNIPVFNADDDAVKQHQVLASFGVSYYQVGLNTASLVADLLNNQPFASIVPIYPKPCDHHGFISKKIAQRYGISLENLDVTVVE